MPPREARTAPSAPAPAPAALPVDAGTDVCFAEEIGAGARGLSARCKETDVEGGVVAPTCDVVAADTPVRERGLLDPGAVTAADGTLAWPDSIFTRVGRAVVAESDATPRAVLPAAPRGVAAKMLTRGEGAEAAALPRGAAGAAAAVIADILTREAGRGSIALEEGRRRPGRLQSL